jgi:hypothetical protein
MRLAPVALCLAFSLVALAGCGEGTPDSPLASKLDAARAISDGAARDKELAKLAVEAATAGDAPIANASLDAIANDGVREQTKLKVILGLGKAGKMAPVNKLIESIPDPKTRDRLRLKIRTRDFSD